MFDLINTLLAVIPAKISHNKIEEVEIIPNYYIRIHGDLNMCEKVLVISHGMGGFRDAGYIISLANRFSNDSNITIITHDNAGAFTNKKVATWNVSGKGQNVFYYDIVEYITSINSKCIIYLSGFSGGASLILSYLTCTQGFVKNSNKHKIKHTFLISVPPQEYHPQLEWIRDNTFLAKYISPAVAYQGVINSLLTGDLKKCFKLLKKPFDIFETNSALSGGKWYEFKKNKKQNLNITVITSPNDPITPWIDNANPCFKMPGCKIYLFPGGGHCGFYRLDGKRDHEELIYEYVKND
jgi:predicted alpha/beta-fold hydrolase